MEKDNLFSNRFILSEFWYRQMFSNAVQTSLKFIAMKTRYLSRMLTNMQRHNIQLVSKHQIIVKLLQENWNMSIRLNLNTKLELNIEKNYCYSLASCLETKNRGRIIILFHTRCLDLFLEVSNMRKSNSEFYCLRLPK